MMGWWITGTAIALAATGVVGIFATRGEAWFALGLVIGGVLEKLLKFNALCKRVALRFYWWCYDRCQEIKWWYNDLKRKLKS